MDNELVRTFEDKSQQLLLDYKKWQTFNYSSFMDVWNQINFKNICKEDLREVEEKFYVSLYIFKATEYFVNAKCLHTKAAAFYFLHVLYYKHAHHNEIKIRLTLDDFKLLKEFIESMKNAKQYELLYVYAKMKSDDAFAYVASETEMTLNPRYKFIRKKENVQFYLKDVLDNLINDSEIMNNLTKTQDLYNSYLKDYLDENAHLTFTLNDNNVVTQLRDLNKSNY